MSFRVLLFGDDEKHPADPSERFELVMRVDGASDPWELVAEMMAEAGIGPGKYAPAAIDIVVEGTLGRKSVDRVRSLAGRGQITWRIDEKSVEPLRRLFGDTAVAVRVEALSPS